MGALAFNKTNLILIVKIEDNSVVIPLLHRQGVQNETLFCHRTNTVALNVLLLLYNYILITTNLVYMCV